MTSVSRSGVGGAPNRSSATRFNGTYARRGVGTRAAIVVGMTYENAKINAQAAADGTGFDHGIVTSSYGCHWFTLPQRQNRCGHETRCEVVSATDLRKCRPGHGPCA